MAEPRLTRRQFVRDTAAGAAALAASVALANIVRVGNAEQADTRSILSYNPDMEYRRCGKTGWMVSAVCLGGHVCTDCRNDPVSIVQSLVDAAQGGADQLAAIKGFTIIRELGRSQMGIVCLARHEQSGKEVALKILVPEVAADRRMVDRFTREAINMLALVHPNIVQFLSFGSAQGTFFFAMEYCAEGTVETLMAQRGGRLPIDEAGRIALQLLEGLEYAHTASPKHSTWPAWAAARGPAWCSPSRCSCLASR